MAIEHVPLPLPASADASKFVDFGREVKGIHPGTLTPEQFEKIQDALYKHDALLFRDVTLTPEQQYALTKAFDPESESYGHGNNKTQGTKKSILHPDLKTIPASADGNGGGNRTPNHTTPSGSGSNGETLKYVPPTGNAPENKSSPTTCSSRDGGTSTIQPSMVFPGGGVGDGMPNQGGGGNPGTPDHGVSKHEIHRLNPLSGSQVGATRVDTGPENGDPNSPSQQGARTEAKSPSNSSGTSSHPASPTSTITNYPASNTLDDNSNTFGLGESASCGVSQRRPYTTSDAGETHVKPPGRDSDPDLCRDRVALSGYPYEVQLKYMEEGRKYMEEGRKYMKKGRKSASSAINWGKYTFGLVFMATLFGVVTFFGKIGLYLDGKQTLPF